MNSLVENLLNSTTTENGRSAFVSTKSAVLDLFSIAGNLRTNQEKVNEYTSRFELAYLEDPTLTLKCLFWMRDIRGGAVTPVYYYGHLKSKHMLSSKFTKKRRELVENKLNEFLESLKPKQEV